MRGEGLIKNNEKFCQKIKVYSKEDTNVLLRSRGLNKKK
jgi:hypothetical protein